MQKVQQSELQSFTDQYLICNNQDIKDVSTNPNNPNEVDQVGQANTISIPNGYNSTKPKEYKRTYKTKNEFKYQANKFLLYLYNTNYNDPCYKRYSSNVKLSRINNTKLYNSADIFGFKITKEPLYLKRVHDFYINFCSLMTEYNPYKDKTKGKMQHVIKCVRFDLHYPKTFTTIFKIIHKQKKKYKTQYTEKFTTNYIVHFNKLLSHWLHYTFDRYMVVYNTEYRKEYISTVKEHTAYNPHHHCYVFISSKYSLKTIFDTINTFWCLALNIPLPQNKKTGLVHQCPPHKQKQHNKHWEYTNGNGLVLDETKASFIPNICSVLMRSSYLCKHIPDNKHVNLGKQFNIIADETTQKYLKYNYTDILPMYYKI